MSLDPEHVVGCRNLAWHFRFVFYSGNNWNCRIFRKGPVGTRLGRKSDELFSSDIHLPPMTAPFICPELFSRRGSEDSFGSHMLRSIVCSTSHSNVCPS